MVALSRNASSPIGRFNVPRRKYVGRLASAKTPLPVRRIDAYANRATVEDRGDKPSSPVKSWKGVWQEDGWREYGAGDE